MTVLYNKSKHLYKRTVLRRNETPEEKLLWKYLRRGQLGYKFKRQFSVGPYVLDFYNPRNKLAIELDGVQHLDNKEYDLERTDYLNSLGINVLWFWNSEVNNDIDKALIKIVSELPPLPYQGEGSGERLT